MAEKEKSEEVFKVNTAGEDTVDEDIGKVTGSANPLDDEDVIIDSATGKGMEHLNIPDGMRAPVFKGGRTVRIMMNEKYAFPHGIQLTAALANHKPQLVGKPSDVQRLEITDDDIIIEISGEIVWRASEDGFPDTQRGPEWVTEILNKAVGVEEVHEPEKQEVLN